jgi:AraC family transcriptional regulator of adaptative response/methylated-DNA-[protein]-cysteine methyltransferase
MSRRRQAGEAAVSAASIERDPRWRAVLARDASADGRFVYAVKTTGVYCRPGSPSRRPRPENIEFFASAQAAEAAGYRPSRHAGPDPDARRERQRSLVAQACARLAGEARPPDLSTLARMAGMSPYHFHRLFKAHTGLTPKAYANAQRAQRVRERVARGGSITDAIFDSGFESNGHFYAGADRILGMTPSRFRAGGQDMDIHFAVGQCSLGTILAAQSARGVCAIFLGDDPDRLVRELQDRFPRANLIGADRRFERQMAKVVGLVEAPGLGLDLPLDVRGTAFQMRVWHALQQIPPGTTASYAQIAKRIGAPRSARAVAGACAANPVAIAIPCHRVVRSDGGLSGYRWGVERKRELLRRETP